MTEGRILNPAEYNREIARRDRENIAAKAKQAEADLELDARRWEQR